MSHITQLRVVTPHLCDVPLLFSRQNQTKEFKQVRGRGGGGNKGVFLIFNLFCGKMVERFFVMRLYIIRVRF